jgi:DNA-binding NarL/FixJ family response regulator
MYHFADKALKGLQKNPVDIVIVEIELHGSNSVEIINKINILACRTRCLVLTMRDDDETVFSALSAGASGYILKDAGLKKTAEALDEVVNGGAPMSPLISLKLLNYFKRLSKKEMGHGLLSYREKEILQQVSRGLLYKEIAALLGIQRETVKKHLSKIYEKLNVQNKIEAINKFFG